MNIQPPSDAELQALFDSPGEVAPQTFEFALVLGGTVSAGAYTAGVLDFLVEALDSWTQARDAGANVPNHKVLVRFLAGTSGGGVNTAVFARALNFGFPPVSRATPDGIAAQNPFYDLWVNHLNLADMLRTSDLDAKGATIASLLNADPVDAAAANAVAFGSEPLAKPRAWLGAPLRFVLTLTNLNGMPYRIDFGSLPLPDGSTLPLQQSYVAHADFARFAVVYPGQKLTPAGGRPDEFVLGFDNARLPNALGWRDFQQFALGTAAFPIGLRARALSRPLLHYKYRLASEPPVPPTRPGEPPHYFALVPDWAAIQDWSGDGIPDTYSFTAVDGGVCNNEPIELARTALAGVSGRNARDGLTANRAVLLIDPFAGSAAMTAPLRPNVLSMALGTVNAMLQDLRYETRDILLAANPDVFSRFMIAAQREGQLGDAALATAGLGAFIGFASPAFRRHDFLLGRKNCQDYLRSVMTLPAANPLFAAWPESVPVADYAVTDQTGAKFLPIIPLVGNARVPETLDPWPAGAFNPVSLRELIEARFKRLLDKEFATGILSDIITWLAGNLTDGTVADFVIGQMNQALKTWHLNAPSS